MAGYEMRYQKAMDEGRRQYADVLDALDEAGWRSAFTQTGGMCAAIEAPLEDGRLLLITNGRGPLAWRRVDQCGWAVGVYAAGGDEPVALEVTEASDVGALLRLVPLVLARSVSTRGGGEHDG